MIFQVADSSHVASIRRSAITLSEDCGFDADKVGRVALVVTEMTTNLLKHAQRGLIGLMRRDEPSGAGIEIMSCDSGPGMGDVGQASAEGFSTTGTSGSGLGIIGRQADLFEIYSRADKGTVAVARIYRRAPERAGTVIGSIVDPLPGETQSGDAYAVVDTPSGPTLMVVDGSGHGPLAAKAAALAVEVFRARADGDCQTLMDRIHHALMPTRGAAVAIARIDRAADIVRFVGVGNIAGAIVSAETKRMVSHNGTAGQLAPRIREFTYPFVPGAAVLLHSDGIGTRWDMGAYPGLAAAHPSLIAGVIFRDFRRTRDDASIVCMRVGSQ